MFKGKLVLDDVCFKVGIRYVKGVIHAEQGIPAFYVPGENIVMRIPGCITADDYETERTACLRLNSKEFVHKVTDDDCEAAVLEEHDDYIDVSSARDFLLSLLEEQKLRKIPQVASTYLVILLGVIGVIASVILRAWFVTAGAVGVILVGFAVGRYWTNTLNSNVLYDAYGHWIDLDTGETNLSNNYTVPGYKE